MDSYDILVIILSSLLAFFLLVSIIVAVMIAKLVKKIESVVATAQDAASNVEDLTAKLSSAASLSAFGGMAHKIINTFKKKGK